MLLTICPQCVAKFKVQPEQLNVRQGRVMCGRCRTVFNAFESLKRENAPDSASPQAAATGKVTPEEKATLARMLDDVVAPPPAPVIPPSVAISPTIKTDLRGNPILHELDNRLLADPRRVRAPVGTGFWRAGVALLATTFVALATYVFRDDLAQQYPPLQPLLTNACSVIGCTIAWGRDASAITVENSDMVSPPDNPTRILLTAQLQNRARVKQDYPTLELRLLDNANQIVLRRNLTPAEYLGRALADGEAIAPGGDLYISLNIDTPTLTPASGYGLRAYYP